MISRGRAVRGNFNPDIVRKKNCHRRIPRDGIHLQVLFGRQFCKHRFRKAFRPGIRCPDLSDPVAQRGLWDLVLLAPVFAG